MFASATPGFSPLLDAHREKRCPPIILEVASGVLMRVLGTCGAFSQIAILFNQKTEMVQKQLAFCACSYIQSQLTLAIAAAFFAALH